MNHFDIIQVHFNGEKIKRCDGTYHEKIVIRAFYCGTSLANQKISDEKKLFSKK